MNDVRLMIPGPVDVAPEVLEEMKQPLVAHYGKDWTEFYKTTLDMLREVIRTRGEVVLLPGSGSAGLDAALGSVLFPNGKALIVQNGFFGERLSEIAKSYTPNVYDLVYEPGQPPDLQAIRRELELGSFDLVAAVHCETSTGMLNPIRELAALCRSQKARFLVDAMSSLAVEPLAMDEWGIDICVSASQKGLEAPPGLAVIAVGTDTWEAIQPHASCGWYLNLGVWKDYASRWADWHPYPVTHAVNNVRALRAGLERILDEGLAHRHARHSSVANMLRLELRRIHLEPYVHDEIASHGVTSVVGPKGHIDNLLANMRDRHGLLLAGSFGSIKDRVFRIGLMGPGATDEAVKTVIAALSEERERNYDEYRGAEKA